MASNFESVHKVRELTTAQVKSLNKDQLREAVSLLMAEPPGSDAEALLRIEGKIDEMKNSISTEISTKIAELKTEQDQKITAIQNENSVLREALMQHQRFLESLESQKRADNVLIFGASEDDIKVGDATYKTDLEKAQMIFDKINSPARIVNVARLGKREAGSNKKRPIKVQLAPESDRNDLLEKAKSLKDETDAVLNSVYVRKDQHPMVRKELARLYAVVKSEKEKPVNQGRTVEFNKDTRCVTVDGTVIDRFKIQFF